MTLEREARRSGIDEYLAIRLEHIFYERTLETIGSFQVNKETIMQGLVSTVKEAGKMANLLVFNGKKQKVKYLQFSYLLSAAKMKKLRLKLDLYDARHYGDLNSHGGYWDYVELFPYIDEDIILLRDELAKRFSRIKDYELLDIRLYYHIGVFRIIWAILMELTADEAFAAALSDVFEQKVTILFGAYLDQSEEIAVIERWAC